jgi:hypothetical protein
VLVVILQPPVIREDSVEIGNDGLWLLHVDLLEMVIMSFLITSGVTGWRYYSVNGELLIR